MKVIYVGDASNVMKRIRQQHYSGNVEASALRKHIAVRKGYPITRTRRASGSTRVRLDLPDPKSGEKNITDYLKLGVWKFIVCSSYEEAHDFQWFVVEKLDPILNVKRKSWDKRYQAEYSNLFSTLESSDGYNISQLDALHSGPGVYVLYHEYYP